MRVQLNDNISAPFLIVPPRKRRGGFIGLGLAAGLLAFGAANAASLGGIKAQSLGANTQVIASCDRDGITSRFDPVYNPEVAGYVANVAVVEGIDEACNGLLIQVTLADAKGGTLGQSEVQKVEGSGMKFANFSTVLADQAERISVVIWQQG